MLDHVNPLTSETHRELLDLRHCTGIHREILDPAQYSGMHQDLRHRNREKSRGQEKQGQTWQFGLPAPSVRGGIRRIVNQTSHLHTEGIMQPLGPPSRSRSSLPQSSTATSCTSVARGELKKLDSHGDDFRKTYPYSAPRLCASWRVWFVGGGVGLTMCQQYLFSSG